MVNMRDTLITDEVVYPCQHDPNDCVVYTKSTTTRRGGDTYAK